LKRNLQMRIFGQDFCLVLNCMRVMSLFVEEC